MYIEDMIPSNKNEVKKRGKWWFTFMVSVVFVTDEKIEFDVGLLKHESLSIDVARV